MRDNGRLSERALRPPIHQSKTHFFELFGLFVSNRNRRFANGVDSSPTGSRTMCLNMTGWNCGRCLLDGRQWPSRHTEFARLPTSESVGIASDPSSTQRCSRAALAAAPS